MALSTVQPVAQWVTASPLWAALAPTPPQMRRPALLRFASDTYMQDVSAIVQGAAPQDLGQLLAKPESFRQRPTGAAPNWQPAPTQLKLYQPMHGHFYLVAASLVCRLAGLPDRFVNTAQNEKASFVLRRLTPNGQETAWVKDPVNGNRWQTLTPDLDGEFRSVAAFEELLPLFPLNFTEDGQPRRLLVGVIPTQSRDTFAAGAGQSALVVPANDPRLAAESDPRLDEANSRVIFPLQALIKQQNAPALPSSLSSGDQAAILARQAEGETDATRFLLLDLADFLNTHFNAQWLALYNGNRPTSGPGRDLYDTLDTAEVDPTVAGAPSWRLALRAIWDERDRINGEDPTPSAALNYRLRNTDLDPLGLQSDLAALLPSVPLPPPVPATNPPVGTVSPRMVPKLDGNPSTLYVLRCVYQRPACGPLEPDVVSAATEPFAIAPLFDPDAPSRPIRIPMPVDTSIAGLRQFPKNVGIMLSDKLREQMSSVTDLKQALDGNLASGESFDLGVICSFSIPVITICALIVLIIFLFLLNIVFWWLPFFRICLPIGLTVKND